MNVLVTGGNGQLGSEIKQKIEQFCNWNFIFTDVADLDITNLTDLQAFVKQQSIHAIINCAAYTAVDPAESNKELAYAVNVEGAKNLAIAAKDVNAKLIHISTDFVFDGRKCLPYSENDIPNPLSVYGKTKLEGEQKILSVNSDAVIIRTAWLYSAFGNNFVKTIRQLGNEKDQLNIVFDQVGTPTWASDLADVLLLILSKIENGKEVKGLYHFSNEGVASWYDFAIEIMELSNINCQVLPIETKQYPTAAQRPLYCVLNKHKIKEDLGIQIPHWIVSLNKCIGQLNKMGDR